MTLIALLHGGMHDGSSWDLVAPALRGYGYDVITPDLPVDDDNAGAEAWARVAIDAIDVAIGDDDDVLVVGHSIAGLCVPVVAARRRIRRMVFLAGLIPVVGRSFAEYLAQNRDVIRFPVPVLAGDGPFGLSFQSVRDGFYHDVPDSLARRMFDGLRGQAFTVFTEQCPISEWPAAPATYIIMRHDRAVSPDWLRQTAAGYPHGDAIEMDGGHSPFLARPDELVTVLARIGRPGR